VVSSWTIAAAVFLTAAGATPPPGAIEGGLVLDVPFVPQEEALCGGAAAAMVLRYWGEHGIDAADFAPLVEDSAGGIRAERLVLDLQGRGWSVIAFSGTEALVRHHLAAGRPVIVLIQDRPRRFHYVVLVAWRNDVVILHDPARAPFRDVSARAFDHAWAVSGRWSLLVLPRAAAGSTGGADSTRTIPESGALSASEYPAAPPPAIAPPPGTFASLVAEGVSLGRAGDLDAAMARLQAAAALWPDSAAAWRELAGIRFRQKRWSDAASFAHRASHLDPDDALAWRVLGASRFLEGRTEDALAAWNRMGEPHLDLIRIEGLTRTRYAIVAGRLGLDSGALLTARSVRRARRRLGDLPTVASSRLDLRPLPGGIAEVETAILERPVFLSGTADAATLVLRSLVNRELAISLAGPTGGGEEWAAAWRWEDNRPRQRVAVSAPHVAGLPGIVGVEGFRERQTYAADLVASRSAGGSAVPPGTDRTTSGLIREVRRRAGVSWSEWLNADLRIEADLGLEHWEAEANRFFAAGLAMELRPLRDALSLRIQGARWFGLGRARPFVAGTADAAWRPAVPGIRRMVVEARVGYRAAGGNAPPALWPGAGTGRGRADLLRAHALLEDGVLEGAVFGRSLWNAGLELDYRPWGLGPLRMGVACFVDAARPGGLPQGRPDVPTQVDAGAGLRLAGLGSDGVLSLDAAHGLTDGESALSLIWRTGRP
jgi:hypothetical protein